MRMDTTWRSALIGSIAAMALLLTASSGAAGAAARQSFMPGEIIVKLKDGSASTLSTSSEPAPRALARLRGQYGFREARQIGTRGPTSNTVAQADSRRSYRIGTSEDVRRLCAILKNDPDVEYAQPNYRYQLHAVPNDPLYAQQYAHEQTQTSLAWDLSTGSRQVVVAVLGTGVDTGHADLKDNIWINDDEIAGNELDDDNNGFIDDVHGWDFGDGDADVNPTGDSSVRFHETAVAGVIAATGNNGIGLCGVNWQCSIMALRLSDDLTSVEIAAALRYAVANGAHVINMSFGGPEPDPLLAEAIDEAHAAGVLLVASAGNDSLDMLTYPAARYNVMAVAATDAVEFREYSNFGLWVDIDAPGTDVASTDIGSRYTYVSGTSFSSPYVASLAALLMAHRPDLTAMDVRAILENTTDPLDYSPLDPNRTYMGTGRVNAYRALSETSALLPFGEIVEPLFGQEISDETPYLDVLLMAQGQTYDLDIREYEGKQWALVGTGRVPADKLIRLSLPRPGPGTYVLRLTTATDDQLHVDMKIFTLTTSRPQKNWPTALAGEMVPEYFMSSPVCVDIDADGRNEVIQSSSASEEATVVSNALLAAQTHIWDASGGAPNGWPQEVEDLPTYSSSAVGDVDGDGDYEVVTVTDWAGMVYVWHAESGELLSGDWPKALNPNGTDGNYSIPCPTLADLDGDGDSEIIVAINPKRDREDRTGLYVLQGDGTILWQKPYDVCGLITAADLDRDRNVELVFCGYGPDDSGQSAYRTFLVDHQGRRLQSWPGGTDMGAVVADLDADGQMEIVFCTDDRVRAVHPDGSTLWQTPILDGFGRQGAMSVGDLDGDGLSEMLVHSYREDQRYAYAQVWAWDCQGDLLEQAGFPKRVLGYSYNSAPVIGDIDGDGQNEVLVGSAGIELAAWNADGTPVTEFPRLGLDPELYTTPALSDLDGDGDMEILFGGYEGRFHVIDLPVPLTDNSVNWGMFRHDPQCSGWALRQPRLDPISVPKQITLGQELTLPVIISNLDNVPTRVYVRNLPEGASFDTETNTLLWAPTAGQAGNTHTMTVFVTDGVRQDRQLISIAVAANVD